MMEFDMTRATVCVFIFTKQGMRKFADALNGTGLQAEDYQCWVSTKVPRRYLNFQLARIADEPLAWEDCDGDEISVRMAEAKTQTSVRRMIIKTRVDKATLKKGCELLSETFGTDVKTAYRDADWLCIGTSSAMSTDAMGGENIVRFEVELPIKA